MFDKLKDKVLESHIRGLLKKYYAQFGLTIKEAERLSMHELLEKMNTFLADKKNEFSYYANVITNLEERVTALSIENKEFKERTIHMKAENKGLNVELAKTREENYNLKLENYLYKQKFDSKDNTKQNNNSLSLSR